MIEALKTNPGAQNLPLGAFAAIHHKAVLLMHYHQGG
jgi:hypothetical protein